MSDNKYIPSNPIPIKRPHVPSKYSFNNPNNKLQGINVAVKAKPNLLSPHCSFIVALFIPKDTKPTNNK